MVRNISTEESEPVPVSSIGYEKLHFPKLKHGWQSVEANWIDAMETLEDLEKRINLKAE